MVEVLNFWRSLKCSWTRRILNSSAFWPKILDKTLEPHNLTTHDLMFTGPSKLHFLSREIKNKFCQNYLTSIGELQREASYALPENFYLFPVFNNPLFKAGRNCLKKLDYGNPRHKITQIADFFQANGQLATLANINSKFETEIGRLQLDRIHSAIEAGRTNLNLNLGICNWHQEPRQSSLIQIACRKLRGCGAFYNIFRSRLNDKGNPPKHETKWHNLLGVNLSVRFWDNAWKLHSSIKDNNPFKWLQCSILRNSIFTNNRLCKFKPGITDRCDLCQLHPENALSLFTQCNVSMRFWTDLQTYAHDMTFTLPTTRLQILFGFLEEKFDSKVNTFIMIGKRVIWASKQKKIHPNISHFKAYLKDYLVILKMCKTIANQCNQFNDQWGNILRDLG